MRLTVKLLHPLTHLRPVLRRFSLIRHNRTVARASIYLYHGAISIDWLNPVELTLYNWTLRMQIVFSSSHSDG